MKGQGQHGHIISLGRAARKGVYSGLHSLTDGLTALSTFFF